MQQICFASSSLPSSPRSTTAFTPPPRSTHRVCHGDICTCMRGCLVLRNRLYRRGCKFLPGPWACQPNLPTQLDFPVPLQSGRRAISGPDSGCFRCPRTRQKTMQPCSPCAVCSPCAECSSCPMWFSCAVCSSSPRMMTDSESGQPRCASSSAGPWSDQQGRPCPFRAGEIYFVDRAAP